MRNGELKYFETDMHNLYSVLSKLDMDKVAGIEYGETILNDNPDAVPFMPSGIMYSYSRSEDLYHVNVYDKNDRRVATSQWEPDRLQQFAVDILQQTTYRYTDLRAENAELQHRMDGLDK
jgi:hypothetical protein